MFDLNQSGYLKPCIDYMWTYCIDHYVDKKGLYLLQPEECVRQMVNYSWKNLGCILCNKGSETQCTGAISWICEDGGCENNWKQLHQIKRKDGQKIVPSHLHVVLKSSYSHICKEDWYVCLRSVVNYTNIRQDL